MAKKQNNEGSNNENPLQKFEIKKQFVTQDKVYEVGDFFYHNNKNVINFLKFNNII